MKDDKASNFIASRRLATRLDVNLISQKFFWDISVVIIVNTVCSNIHAMRCCCCYRHQIPPQSINWTQFLRFSTSDCAPYFFISFFTSRFFYLAAAASLLLLRLVLLLEHKAVTTTMVVAAALHMLRQNEEIEQAGNMSWNITRVSTLLFNAIIE